MMSQKQYSLKSGMRVNRSSGIFPPQKASLQKHRISGQSMSELKSTYSRTDKVASYNAQEAGGSNSQLNLRLHRIGSEIGEEPVNVDENPYEQELQGANSHMSLPSVRTSNASPAQIAILKRKKINSSLNQHIAQSQERLASFEQKRIASNIRLKGILQSKEVDFEETNSDNGPHSDLATNKNSL